MLDSAKTRYYYYNDNWQILAEYDLPTSGGVCMQYYAYGNYIDEALMTVIPAQGGIQLYYLHDHLFSPEALVDSSGAVVERYEYDAYGTVHFLTSDFGLLTSSPSQPFFFTGRQLDVLDAGSCKLYHYRHRDYSPTMGRFYQPDPLRYIDGMNLYEYVNNNPITYMDYSGMFKMGKRGHDKVTKNAFDEAMSNIELTSQCKKTIQKSLIKANTGQDGGDAFKDLRRHYNRDIYTPEDDADTEYSGYLSEESQNIDAAKRGGDCQKELEAMGRLEHSLQDFFAHAVGPNGNAEIWSRGSNKLDPYHRGNTHPSSYPGEHRGAHEPGSEEEQQARFDAAVRYMTDRYKNNYSDFLNRCACKLCKK